MAPAGPPGPPWNSAVGTGARLARPGGRYGTHGDDLHRRLRGDRLAQVTRPGRRGVVAPAPGGGGGWWWRLLGARGWGLAVAWIALWLFGFGLLTIVLLLLCGGVLVLQPGGRTASRHRG